MELTFEPEPTETTPRRRLRWLLVAAVTPWVLVAAFLAAGRTNLNPPTLTAAPIDSYDITPQATPAPEPIETAATPPPQLASSSPVSLEHKRTTFAAYAMLTAHEYFMALNEDDERIELLQTLVEEIDFTSPTVPVATVLLNIRVDGTANTARVAIPMTITSGGGITHFPPYPITPPEIDPAGQTIELDISAFTPLPSTDAVTQALHTAGYRNFTVDGAVTGDGWPIIAIVNVDYGAESTTNHFIFLHDTGNGLVVAGQPSHVMDLPPSQRAAR